MQNSTQNYNKIIFETNQWSDWIIIPKVEEICRRFIVEYRDPEIKVTQ